MTSSQRPPTACPSPAEQATKEDVERGVIDKAESAVDDSAFDSSSGNSRDVLEATHAQSAPSSRLGRAIRLGWLAPKAIPVAFQGAKRAMGLVRTQEQERIAREKTYRDAKKAGAALLKTLGEMKGLPMKIGQMVSYIEGLAPPGYDEKVKRVLRRLQEKAPALSPEASEQVIMREFGVPPQQLFATWQRQPFAAASIGQVHRATTHGGEQVAVKVQYPGIDKAVENDLKSLAVLEKFLSPIARPYQSKETLEEVSTVFMAELDYVREAQYTELFRRIHADCPHIIIPSVYHALSTRRVLTSSFVLGQGYGEFCKHASQTQRDEAGTTIWSFMMRSLFEYGVLYADPHPGNYRFFDGPNVGFLDFGCVRILPAHTLRFLKALMLSALDGDWQQFDQLFMQLTGIEPDDHENWDLYRSYTLALFFPFMTDEPYQCTSEGAKEAVQYLVRGHQKMIKEAQGGPQLPTPVHLPPELTFVNRLQWGLTSVLGGLGTCVRFRPITEPWIRAPLKPFPITISPARDEPES